ncbi:MAG TPA: hypothetical protein VKV32_16505 [Stellaceae bacterium]|nr:hypothetical protein [Stellaceae bacterium]
MSRTGGFFSYRSVAVAALIASAAALGGCATGPDWAAIGQQAGQLRAGCESQYKSGIIKTALATEQCANGPIRDLYARAGFLDMDVLDAYFARREAIAAQIDRKAIPPEEARAEFAQALVDENTALQQRAASRAMSYAASTPMFCDRLDRMTMICD